MALQRCTECGKDVSTKAATCPNCGAPIKKKSGCLKFGCFTVIIIFALVIWAGIEGQKYARTPEGRAATTRRQAEAERDRLAAEVAEQNGPVVQPRPAVQAEPQVQARPQWYEGGTLHRKTMKEWRNAPYADRLATTADIVTSTAKVRGITFRSMDDVKKQSVALEHEISVAGEGGYADNQQVSQIASACMVLMDSNK